MTHAAMTSMERPGPVDVRASGFSLVELMISTTISLILLATLLAVVANASSARSKFERNSRQFENGRYTVDLLTNDLRLAGYYGEVELNALAGPAPLPDPCSTAAAEWEAAMPIHVQGYHRGLGAPACVPADVKANTDILVVRRVKTCVAGVGGCEGPVSGKPYLQSSLCSSESKPYIIGAFGSTTFGLKRQDCVTPAALREYVVNIYFISTDNGAGKKIPTLMKMELAGSTMARVPLVEGIEEMHIEYGIDEDGDGHPDAYTADPTRYSYPGCAVCSAAHNWSNVITARLHVLARSPEPFPGYIDINRYTLGHDAAGEEITFGPENDAYRRQVYTALVRIVNPAGRRDRP